MNQRELPRLSILEVLDRLKDERYLAESRRWQAAARGFIDGELREWASYPDPRLVSAPDGRSLADESAALGCQANRHGTERPDPVRCCSKDRSSPEQNGNGPPLTLAAD